MHDSDETAVTPVGDDADAARAQWAPTQPARRKRRLGLWIGIPVGVVALGAAAASLLLIAPGTTVAGVPVGLLTPGAAAAAVEDRLADTTLQIGDERVSGADLGAEVDGAALTAAAFETRPAWNLSQWFGEPIAAEITLDTAAANDALRAAASDSYVDPTPAGVSFDGTSYTVTPDVPGQGIDVEATRSALQGAFDAGQTDAPLEAPVTEVRSATETADAEAAAGELNAMLDAAGFYVGDERTVPIDRAVAASWLTVAPGSDGSFEITADAAAIQTVVDTLPGLVDREPQNGTVIVNSAGTELETVTETLDGRTLQDTSGVADAFAAQLSEGASRLELPVEVVPAVKTTAFREIEVDLGAQRVFLKENGAVVDSWSVSTGRPGGSITHTGRYTINAHVRSQTMRGTVLDDPNARAYSLDNVQWVMYFNGDQAFHGVYWHTDYLRGVPNSNGCVGMSNARAEQLYRFAAQGTEVWIHGQTPGSA